MKNNINECYTGFCGEQDVAVRSTGEKFVVFEFIDTGLVVTKPGSPDFLRHEQEEIWDAFLWMIATSEDDAKAMFYDAQDQWKYHQNHGERKDDIVLLPEGERPE